MNTQLRGNFPGQPTAPKKPPRQNAVANIDAIVKTQAPYVGTRPDMGSKWAALFDGVKAGDCFEMPSEETARAERALRMYLTKKGYTSRDYVIRRRCTCEDGLGRVWVIKLFAPMKVAA